MRFLLASALALVLCAAAPPDAAIHAVLDRQAADWNHGDIPAFMRGYDPSDTTLFIGKDITRGWQRVLERYRKAYPTPERMGQLAFSDIEVHPLGKDHALVVGRFHLTRSGDSGGDAAGVFSLIFHRTASGWKIIADHTS